MYARQSGVVNAMLDWHATAAGLVSFMVTPSAITAAGCSLTNITTGTGVPAFPACTYNGTTNVYAAQKNYTSGANTPPNCSGSQTAPCFTPLPTGYTFTSPTSPLYSFYSVAFTASGLDYVLTYVPPPTSSSDSYGIGFLCLPGYTSTFPASCSLPHTQFSLPFNTFYKQLTRNLRVTPMYYGTVANTAALCGTGVPFCLVTPTVVTDFGTKGLVYPVPSSGVPVNSIGIITQITPCSSSLCN